MKTPRVEEIKVQRFEFECSFLGIAEAKESPTGLWVLHEDYEELRALALHLQTELTFANANRK